ncbi:MAG: hypothetical protein ABSH12_01160 [Endomicrobiales bacterium]|jgi:hypothetical protein
MTAVEACGLQRYLMVVVAGTSLCGFLYADDYDHLFLPETPPTIEWLKKPPLDKPIFQRQEFLSQPDIILPPALLGLDFFPFYQPEYPRMIEMGAGSFGSRLGEFYYASPLGFAMQYRMFHSDGETPLLHQEQQVFSVSGEELLNDPVRVNWDAHSDESVVFDQDQKNYTLSAAMTSYLRKNVRLGADVGYDAGRLGEDDHNENIRGDVNLLWQPWEHHSIDVIAASENDSTFTSIRDFNRVEVLYTVEPLTTLMVSGGCRYLNDAVFPQGDITWFALYRLRISVKYQPGIEKLSWADTYLNNRWYAAVNPLLVYPENNFFLSEEISYHQGDRTLVTARFTQQTQKDYLYWEQLPGDLTITPENGPEISFNEASIDFSQKGDLLFAKLSATARSDSNEPLVPQYRCTTEIGCVMKSWTLSAGYDYVDSRLVRLGSTQQLDAQGSVTAGIKKKMGGSADVAISVGNLTGQHLAVQPGFIEDQPDVSGSVTVHF